MELVAVNHVVTGGSDRRWLLGFSVDNSTAVQTILSPGP